MATALESPDLIIGPARNHCGRSWISTEEMVTNVGAVFCLECLIVPVWSLIHQANECAFTVLGKKWIPLATPNDFDDVPSCAAKNRFEFLDDLSVSTNWSVKALQVAVNYKGQIVESVASCQADCTQTFRLVHFAIAQKCPNVLIAG